MRAASPTPRSRATRRGAAALALLGGLAAPGAAALECLVPMASDPRIEWVDDVEERPGVPVMARSGAGPLRLTAAGRLTAGEAAASGWVYDEEGLGAGRSVAGAERGLFHRQRDDSLIRVAPERDTGAVPDVERLRDGSVLVGAQRGVFLWAPGAPLRALEAERPAGRIRDVEALANGRGLAGGEGGLFAFTPGAGLRWVPGDRETGAVRDIETLRDGRVLVATASGLFRFGDDGLRRMAGELAGERVNEIQQLGDGRIVVGTARGVFQGDGQRARRIASRGAMAGVDEVEELRDGRVVAGSERGAFRGVLLPLEQAELRVRADGSDPSHLRFELWHPCASADDIDVRVAWSVDGALHHVSAEREAQLPSGGARFVAPGGPWHAGTRLRVTAFSAMAGRRVEIGHAVLPAAAAPR